MVVVVNARVPSFDSKFRTKAPLTMSLRLPSLHIFSEGDTETLVCECTADRMVGSIAFSLDDMREFSLPRVSTLFTFPLHRRLSQHYLSMFAYIRQIIVANLFVSMLPEMFQTDV